VAESAHRGGSFGTRDPEVGLLRLVGPEHVDALLDPLVHQPLLSADIYLIEALKSLVTEDHKKLVFDSLPRKPALVSIVRLRGWTPEAAPILLKILANKPNHTWYLPPDLIEAVAGLGRPGTYRLLRDYFLDGQNHYSTWRIIKDLPELDLGATVQCLWQRERDQPNPVLLSDAAAVAAHYGYLDALGVLFANPRQWPEREIIRTLTPFPGPYTKDGGFPDAAQAKKWFDDHRGTLRFQDGAYVVAD
jgi:hypothetical protein